MLEHKWAGLTLDMLPEAHRKLAEVIGVEATLRLSEVYGGLTLYVPKLDMVHAAMRTKRIRAEYDGTNARQLARKYGVSNRCIQRAVSFRAA